MKSDRRELLLTLEAAAGDREAYNRLLERVEQPLHRYIASLVGRPDVAHDVLQEVFVRIYRKLRWLRDPTLFRPWAYRIATRECLKQLKRERRWTAPGANPEEIPEPVREVSELAAEMAERLPGLLERLSPASRTVIALHYLHEMTIEETAAVLDISTGTAKSRLAYGLAALRRQWKEMTDE